jgi:signal transduction histidine kinase
MVERFGAEVDEALNEVRNVARGIHPHVLSEAGVAAALRTVALNAPVLVTLDDRGLERHEESTELAMYFSILEALQNVAKHAGPDAAATIRLGERPGWAWFTIDDDGVGFEPRTIRRGAGLRNITERVEAAGGTVDVESRPGRGTRIHGRLPV